MTGSAATRVSPLRSSSILITLLLSSLFSIAQEGKTGSLSTNKIDYQPGDIVSIIGENWAPGETVNMVVGEDPAVHPDRALVAVANENGQFTNTDFVIEQDHIGVHFIVTATGATSGYNAYIHFFDGEGPKTSGTAQDYTITKSSSGNAITHDGATQTQLPFAQNNGNQMLPINLPFSFRVYNTTFAAGAPISVTTNGVVQFVSNLTTGNNTSITSAPFDHGFLVYWDNLGLQRNSPNGVFYSVSGTAPNRVLNIEWRQMSIGGTSNPPVVTFEARFYETSFKVEFIYGAGPATGYGAGATIGVLETNTTHYTQHSFDTADTVGPGVKLTLTPGSPLDNQAPVITVPANITKEATGATTPVTYSPAPTANDDVDGPVAVTCDPVSGSSFPVGTATVTCKAKDTAGNEGTKTFTVTITDTTPPTIAVGGLSNGVLTSKDQTTVNFTATATDLVDGSVAVSCTPQSGSTFKYGSTDVNCTATDAHNNTGTFTFSVLVTDGVAPVLTLPTDITKEATSAAGEAVTFEVSALDAVDGPLTPTCDHNSGETFPLGTTAVHCSVKDKSGNEATGSFTITVQDTTPPTLTVPAVVAPIEATGPDGATVTFTVTAHDTVDPAPTVDCDHDSGSKFPVGDTTVSCTAKDKSGNVSAPKTFKVTVQDTTPPDLTLPTDITKEGDTLGGAHVNFTATAHDIVDGNVTVACTPESGSLFAVEAKKVTCTATDKHGNKAEGSFNVTVKDTTPPNLALPADMTIEATGPQGAMATFTTTAHDIVDGDVAVTCSPTSGSTFGITTTAVHCSATDKATNKAEGSFNVTVQDTTPPALTIPTDMIVEATGPAGAQVNFAASAVDIVDGVVAVSCVPASGSTFALGTTTVSCSAKDAHLNVANGTFNILVRDTTPPVLTLPGPMTAIATSTQGAVVSFSTSAYDLVSGNVPVSCNAVSGANFAPGLTTVTCSATDAAGNKATGSFTVSVTFAWSGFLQPINADNSSVFKQGSTVPVKFQLTGASTGISNLVAKILVAKVSNGVIGSFYEDVVSTSAATTGNLFRYDPTSNQYIFNWSTKGTSTGTYVIKVDMGDGVDNRIVYVGLR
jgi:hypothetical protein